MDSQIISAKSAKKFAAAADFRYDKRVSGEGKGVVKGAAILQWVMTVAGFLLLAGVIFWEVFLLLNGLPTDIIQVWPLLVIGALLFAGGCS